MDPAVIDASFALAWVLPDEQAAPLAQRLLSAFDAGEVDLAAPSLWEYEVANALRASVARRRVTQQRASEALRSLLYSGISLHEFGPIADRAWNLALEHDLTVYDAAYLALAEERHCALHTRDRALAEAARKLGLPQGLGERD